MIFIKVYRLYSILASEDKCLQKPCIRKGVGLVCFQLRMYTQECFIVHKRLISQFGEQSLSSAHLNLLLISNHSFRVISYDLTNLCLAVNEMETFRRLKLAGLTIASRHPRSHSLPLAASHLELLAYSEYTSIRASPTPDKTRSLLRINQVPYPVISNGLPVHHLKRLHIWLSASKTHSW